MATNNSIIEPSSWQNYSFFSSGGSCNNSVIASLELDSYQCALAEFCVCPDLQANPDIAGPGVVASFVLTAALTVIATAAFILVRRYDPKHVPKNEVDRWVYQNIALKLYEWRQRTKSQKSSHTQPAQDKQPRVSQQTSQEPSRWLEQCLKSIVVGLSDQQLVTGLSILITACFMYTKGSIEVYYFQVVMDLAWFSANTHMWSLLLTLEYFAEHDNKARQWEASQKRHFRGYRALRTLTGWRLLCIYVTVAFLLWGTILVSFRDLYDWATCPMQCVPKNLPGGEPLRWSIVSGLFIGWEYIIMIPYAFLSDANKERVEARLRFIPKSLGLLWTVLASTVFQVAMQLAWFGIGCWSIASDLEWGHGWMTVKQKQKEREWGFGQVVPLILVMLPFMAAVEVYVDSLSRADSDQD